MGLRTQERKDRCVYESLRNFHVGARNLGQTGHKIVKQEIDTCNYIFTASNQRFVLNFKFMRRKRWQDRTEPVLSLIPSPQFWTSGNWAPLGGISYPINGECLFHGWFCYAGYFLSHLLSFCNIHADPFLPSSPFLGKTQWIKQDLLVLNQTNKRNQTNTPLMFMISVILTLIKRELIIFSIPSKNDQMILCMSYP